MSFCSELSAKLDTIIALLQNTGLACCPDNANFVTPPDVDLSGSGDVPQSIIDAGYASGVTDWAGYNEYKCMVSHLVIDNLISKMQDLPTIVTGGAGLLSVLLVFFGWITGVSGIVIAGIAIALGDMIAFVEVVKDFTTSDFEGIAEELETDRDALVCAMMLGDGIDNVRARFNAAVDANFTVLEASLIKLMNIGPTFATLFGGYYSGVDAADVMATYGLDVNDFDCTCAGDDIGDGSLIYGTSTDFSNGDTLVTDVQYEIVGANQGGYYSIGFLVRNIGETGPLEGHYDWWIDSITGWTSYDVQDLRYYHRQAGTPFYYQEAYQNWSPPTAPFKIATADWVCGYRINSTAAFTIVVRLVPHVE